MIRLVVDAFGGDKGPEAVAAGCLEALGKQPDLSLIVTGDEEILRPLFGNHPYGERLEIVHAPEVIECGEKPTDVIRQKRESSMMKAIHLMRRDETLSGMVSIGSTGALVAAATLYLPRLRGVIRPTFCPILPTMAGGIVGICDSGANVDITPDYLCQYAVMGSAYLETVFGVSSPRVALLNIGTEEGKGDDLRREAYGRLKEMKNVNFVGNHEGRELLSGNFDLILCDGFSGNVLIKATEGTALELLKKIKKDIYAKPLYKFGALFMSRMFREEKEFMNYQNYGGSVLLGSSRVVVKGHGSSSAHAVAVCIEQAYRMQAGGLNEKIEKMLAANAE